MRRCAIVILLATVSASARAQESAAVPGPAQLLEAYRKLPPERRAAVVRVVEQRLVRDADDHLQRIQSCAAGAGAYARPEPAPWFEPREFAPVAAARHLVPVSAPAHRTATAGMAPFVCLPELHAVVSYDWRRGVAVHAAGEPGDDQRCENYASGLPPAADHAFARTLAVLDHDPEQRRAAEYFEHLYADRQGQVFAGVTLFSAWYARGVVEMPDTDVIAFARQVLGNRTFVAPIPADQRREKLYQQLRQAFADHREYRTLRLVLAATYVAAHPTVDATYRDLIPRCHWLWQQCGEDPEQVRTWLIRAKDRAGFLREIDARMAVDSTAADGRARDLEAMADHLRHLLATEVARGNG